MFSIFLNSNTFEDFPVLPASPTLCGPDDSCFPFMVMPDAINAIITLMITNRIILK